MCLVIARKDNLPLDLFSGGMPEHGSMSLSARGAFQQMALRHLVEERYHRASSTSGRLSQRSYALAREVQLIVGRNALFIDIGKGGQREVPSFRTSTPPFRQMVQSLTSHGAYERSRSPEYHTLLNSQFGSADFSGSRLRCRRREEILMVPKSAVTERLRCVTPRRSQISTMSHENRSSRFSSAKRESPRVLLTRA